METGIFEEHGTLFFRKSSNPLAPSRNRRTLDVHGNRVVGLDSVGTGVAHDKDVVPVGKLLANAVHENTTRPLSTFHLPGFS